jgi:ABC-type glycerol-3-phosphate transport system substrate-binding protein
MSPSSKQSQTKFLCRLVILLVALLLLAACANAISAALELDGDEVDEGDWLARLLLLLLLFLEAAEQGDPTFFSSLIIGIIGN